MEAEPSSEEDWVAASEGGAGEGNAAEEARRADGALSWGDAGPSQGAGGQVNACDGDCSGCIL